jgi:hypothetical protein
MNQKKETRDEKARRELREKSYGHQLAMANKKMDYIKNLINGRYYLARCNMLAEQIQTKKIEEKIDGCLKTEEYMRSEYALTKMQAIMSLRNSHFAKQDLLKEFKLTEEQIKEVEEDYYDGKIIREDYDESYKRGNKAEFINSQRD